MLVQHNLFSLFFGKQFRDFEHLKTLPLAKELVKVSHVMKVLETIEIMDILIITECNIFGRLFLM